MTELLHVFYGSMESVRKNKDVAVFYAQIPHLYKKKLYMEDLNFLIRMGPAWGSFQASLG